MDGLGEGEYAEKISNAVIIENRLLFLFSTVCIDNYVKNCRTVQYFLRFSYFFANFAFFLVKYNIYLS